MESLPIAVDWLTRTANHCLRAIRLRYGQNEHIMNVHWDNSAHHHYRPAKNRVDQPQAPCREKRRIHAQPQGTVPAVGHSCMFSRHLRQFRAMKCSDGAWIYVSTVKLAFIWPFRTDQQWLKEVYTETALLIFVLSRDSEPSSLHYNGCIKLTQTINKSTQHQDTSIVKHVLLFSLPSTRTYQHPPPINNNRLTLLNATKQEFQLLPNYSYFISHRTTNKIKRHLSLPITRCSIPSSLESSQSSFSLSGHLPIISSIYFYHVVRVRARAGLGSLCASL